MMRSAPDEAAVETCVGATRSQERASEGAPRIVAGGCGPAMTGMLMVGSVREWGMVKERGEPILKVFALG
jgi:hypothetical protein